MTHFRLGKCMRLHVDWHARCSWKIDVVESGCCNCCSRLCFWAILTLRVLNKDYNRAARTNDQPSPCSHVSVTMTSNLLPNSHSRFTRWFLKCKIGMWLPACGAYPSWILKDTSKDFARLDGTEVLLLNVVVQIDVFADRPCAWDFGTNTVYFVYRNWQRCPMSSKDIVQRNNWYNEFVILKQSFFTGLRETRQWVAEDCQLNWGLKASVCLLSIVSETFNKNILRCYQISHAALGFMILMDASWSMSVVNHAGRQPPSWKILFVAQYSDRHAGE